MKKRNIVPKAERIVPRATTLEDLMDYFEYLVEFEQRV